MSMKLRFQTKSRIWIEFEANDCKDAVRQLSKIQNVFEEHQCGACGCTNLLFKHAENQGYHFYELHCQNADCRAKLNFGQRKEDQELFPRRKDEKGKYLPNRGWVVRSNDSENQEAF